MPFKPTCSAVEVSRVMDKQYGWKWGEGYNFRNKEEWKPSVPWKAWFGKRRGERKRKDSEKRVHLTQLCGLSSISNCPVLSCFTSFLRLDHSHWSWGPLIFLGRLVNEFRDLSVSAPHSPVRAGVTGTSHCVWPFRWVLVTQTQVLMLVLGRRYTN